MGEKRLLIADPSTSAWDEFRQTLGESWIVVGVPNGAAAMAEAQKQPFDVVVAHYELTELDGAELLNRIRVSNPKTLRFIAAAESQREKVVCHMVGGHQFLPIPYHRATLKAALERSLAENYGMSQSMRELVGRIRTFPSIPSLYIDVVNALKDPSATTEDIGNIIAKDMAMTTKLVQIINSAYFGLPRTITDPTEAVGLLGFETVKSLIMTVKLLSQYDKVKPVYFSIDSIWKHSTTVAQNAKSIAILQTGDTELAGHAYTAGLMHDLGKVILAANFDDQYHGAHTLARKQQVPLWDVEKEIFGASHGEIGAYLLGLWGISAEVTRVAAHHHHPLRSEDDKFTALTAVHVANALEYEGAQATGDDLPLPVVDLAYLHQIGVEDRLEGWREALRDPEALAFETKLIKSKVVSHSPTKTISPPPVSAATLTKFSPSHSPRVATGWKAASRWLPIVGGVVLIIGGLALYEKSQYSGDSGQIAAETVPPAKGENAKPADPAKIPEAKVAQPPAEMKPAPAPAPAPTPVQVTVQQTPQPAPAVVPEKSALEKIKVRAIFYSAKHPTALINGQTVGINDEVANCRVTDISGSTVTMEYKGQRKTFVLP